MKTLTITLDTAKEMYKQCDQSIKALLLENFTKEELEEKELPKTFEELEHVYGYYVDESANIRPSSSYITETKWDHNKMVWPTKEYAEASLALAQLLQLRDRYNDGEVLDFKNEEIKYSIVNYKGTPSKSHTTSSNSVLCFKSEDLADKFYNNFLELITQALPLL